MDEKPTDRRPLHRGRAVHAAIAVHERVFVERDESALVMCRAEFPVSVHFALDACRFEQLIQTSC